MYYWLVNSTGKDVGSASLQTEGMTYSMYDKDSIKNMPFFQKPDFIPNTNALQVSYKAKVTDIIKCVFTNSKKSFFLNDKTKNLLLKYNLSPYELYEAKVLHRDKIYDNYFLIHFIDDMTKYIDYEKSTFNIKNMIEWQKWEIIKENIKFKNYEELINFYFNIKDSSVIMPLELNMINQNLDLLAFKFFGNNIIINEKIKTCLESNKITGIEILTLI